MVRGRRAAGPARGWPGNGLRSRLRPLPAAALCGAGGPAGRRRGRAEEGAGRGGGACVPPADRSRPGAGAGTRAVQNQGATAPRRSRPRPAGCSSTDARSRAREVSERAHQRPRRAQLSPGLGARLGRTPPPPGPGPWGLLCWRPEICRARGAEAGMPRRVGEPRGWGCLRGGQGVATAQTGAWGGRSGGPAALGKGGCRLI